MCSRCACIRIGNRSYATPCKDRPRRNAASRPASRDQPSRSSQVSPRLRRKNTYTASETATTAVT